MKLQCYICGKSINNHLKQPHNLDPCQVTVESNCDLDRLDRRIQTFWCHFDCFKSGMNDSRFVELEEDVATEREFLEEEQLVYKVLGQLTEYLNNHTNLLNVLFNKPKGVWYCLPDLLPSDKPFIKEITKAEKEVFAPILISWMKDERLKENIRLVSLSIDYDYDNYMTFQIEIKD